MTTPSTSAQVIELETALRRLSHDLTEPRPGECLICYVARMLGQFGCRGLHWATRYRDVRSPRATALARRLGEKGAFCDCEIFFNAYELAPRLLRYDAELGDWIEPDTLPPCGGVRNGSVQPCGLWVRLGHGRW